MPDSDNLKAEKGAINHGEIAMQKPIGEYAEYIKNLIPADIDENYAIKPMFKNIASEEDIRKGIIAFRDFLYLFCERLVSDGHLYSKPRETKNPADYPFLQNINLLLIEIGYYGKPAESGDSLLVAEMPLFNAPKPKISFPKQMECMRFLALCGFVFEGIDLDMKTFDISEEGLKISYPKDPIMLTGMKALSVSAKELWVRFYNNADNLLRCDYRMIKAEDTDVVDVLKDVVHSLPEKLREFVLELHRRYINKGMVCGIIYDDAVHFAYSYVKNSKKALAARDIYQQRVFEFSLSVKYGYCLVVRSKRTDKYEEVIEKFPLYLRGKIARGYGCDRKLRNEKCQGGCQGIRIPLDDQILTIKQDVEIWLDNELPNLSSK